LLRSLESVQMKPDAMILLDVHGKGVGSSGGDLSLLQLGLDSKTFMIDVVALHKDIPRLFPFLQSRSIRKVVWDGRLAYSELWHRYGICLENVLDLQLVYLHEKYDETQRKCIPLSGKTTAIKDKKLLSIAEVESEVKRTHNFGFLANVRTSQIESSRLV